MEDNKIAGYQECCQSQIHLNPRSRTACLIRSAPQFDLIINGLAVVPVPDELVKDDNVLDLTTLDPRLEQLFKEMDDEKLNAKYDLRRKIDRHNIDPRSPMFALHAIGKVTAAKVKEGQSGFEQSARAEENRAWGTGFMFTPCHMMTNHHVVCEKQVINGRKVCKGNEAINIMGRSANFSFGENEDGSDFAMRVTGIVVASQDDLDYAVLRIESLRSELVPYISPNFSNISNINNSISLGAGHPAQSLGPASHKIYGMKARLKDLGHYVHGGITSTAGNSGSPTVYLHDQSTIVVSGLMSKSEKDHKGKSLINSEPSITSMPTIGKDLRSRHGKVFDEIKQALTDGQCK